ncbi:MAG: hypothetical protein M3Y85_04240 [Bacteroidota bacterium]|nr:hypothetical protein [Bacteroidota bacterium]
MEQIQKRPVRTRRSRQEIDDLLNLFARGNLSVNDFCKQHSISRANFHKWRSRYSSHPVSKKKTSGFARLHVASAPLAPQGLFAEVKGIRFYQPVSASFLKELLA